MFKLVDSNYEGPFYGSKKYIVGKTVKEDKANTDEKQECEAGISLATLDWCIKQWNNGYRIMICEFTKNDIAAIPIGSDGKIRVKKCRVVEEIDLRTIRPWIR